ncbi:MAG: LON peptidase substrate-binding domain-containing protein [Terriglobia bacterium]
MQRRKVLQLLAAAAPNLWAATRLPASTLLEPSGLAPKPQGSVPDLLLPLFPLELVLLPHVNLPLHIFEERYKEMIGDCLKNQWEFGILAVQGEAVQTFGCTASISEVLERFPDGRMNILTRGQRRFEISQLNEDRSYLRGKPQFFDDDEAAPLLGDLPKQAIEV